MSRARLARLLVIAGSDSSGGAGIQGDIKTATVFGAYAMTAITAVTVQDTRAIHSIHPIPAQIVREQIVASLADIGADAIKTGMLGSAEIVETVAKALAGAAPGIPLVVDPVMASTGGTALLDGPAIAILKARLFPLATLVTPNIPEASALCGFPIRSHADAQRCARTLLALGPKAILIKGGHGEGGEVEDLLFSADGEKAFVSPRIETRHTHGTGCSLATAVAVELARGLPLSDAVEHARKFVHEAIRTAPGFGSGRGPLNHMHGIVGKGA